MSQPTSVSPWLGASLASVRSLMPGIGLSLVLAFSATFVSEHYGGPKYLYALLMGMAFHHLLGIERYTAGIEFSAKKLVRVGVALLGLRIMVGDLHDLGVFGAVALAGGLVSTIVFGMWCAKRLGLPKSLGILSGGGTGICGISATLAIAATLPPSEEVEQMTLLSAIGIATLSTLAMVTYPLLVAALHLSTTEAGFMLGGSIHDVAQVVGAGYIISPDVADFATLSKMFRVAMLMPVVVVFAMLFRHSRAAASPGTSVKLSQVTPVFLLVFIGLAVLNNTVSLPKEAVSTLTDLSGWCLVVSIAALGVKTSLDKLSKLGWRPIALFVFEALFILGWMVVALFVGRSL
jgi:uncharacterized integral membrane protein (TIGR00698 family)